MNRLINVLKKYKSAVIGFSGGGDSSLLLHAALKAELKVLAVTFHSNLTPLSELTQALDIANKLNARHMVLDVNLLSLANLKSNPKDRCYICKKHLFSTLRDIAVKESMETVMDGSNLDDLSDYRPGRVAIAELGVKSPLIEAELRKSDIRQLLVSEGLPECNRPSFACYFSRFPYDSEVSEELIKRVDESEQGLIKMGLTSARVRCHGDVARIEVNNSDFNTCVTGNMRTEVINLVKKTGFIYVAIDMEGYRTGSMNETILK